MNNIGIGVDIESIKRFENINPQKDANFCDKIFTQNEKNYCFKKKSSAQHLAVRFAAKEAIIKAIGCLDFKLPPIKSIEIINDKTGAPKVYIHVEYLKHIQAKISLSHCEDKAIAFAIIKNVKK